MTQMKPWWMSKTVWTGLAVALLTIATAFGIVPEWLTQAYVEEVIVAALGLLTVVFRMTATTEIGATPPAPTE